MKKIFYFWLVWRISTFAFALVGIVLLPLRNTDYLGGSVDNYSTNPLFWGWANFDGDYYLKIAIHGYQSLTHSFFPLYPLFAKYLAMPLGANFSSIVVAGLIISNLSFLVSLFIFWRLIRMDYSEKTAFLSLILLLVFPTSFYFGAIYTESLFLLLALSTFYAARKKKWFFAGVLGMLASMTRVVGVLLLPALLIEWFQNTRSKKGRSSIFRLLFLLLVPIGLATYMFFLQKTTGNSLAFYNELSYFGEQRSGQLVPLYQVFWRYIKMLATTTMSDPIYLTVSMEAVAGFFVPVLLLWGYIKKMRISYLLFGALAYILPTLTGSFSSMPRYVLVIFPVFILLGIFFSERRRLVLFLSIISVILLAIETMFFIRGYWVA